MGGLFGGGGSPTYIPAPAAVQAQMPNSVDASKAQSDAADKIKKQLAAQSNSSNNISTSPLGIESTVPVQNKTLLGQ